jgi:hypothetical protein
MLREVQLTSSIGTVVAISDVNVDVTGSSATSSIGDCNSYS